MTTDPAWQKAQEACASLRPQPAGDAGPGRADTPATNAAPTADTSDSANQAFVSCLKDRKIELPADGASALDRTDTAVAEALKICEPLLS